MEDLVIDTDFWQNKKVFVTGHTGFKGSWLCLWLQNMGAKVTGYALEPPTSPSMYHAANVKSGMTSIHGDIRELDNLSAALQKSQAEIVIHMAAQALVLESYETPAVTYSTNVMGTVNLLEAARHCKSVHCVLNITSDKCYENIEQTAGYKESDPMGGSDPYSSSKGCAELVTTAYRKSFYANSNIALASARSGNVFGGGDWAKDRLIPDIIRAFAKNESVEIRSPNSIRPWQHVLEPLAGYLLLCENLYKHGKKNANGWNFGPPEKEAKTVEWMTEKLAQSWGGTAKYHINQPQNPIHEARTLTLNCTKAKEALNWQPRWTLGTSLTKCSGWYKAYLAQENMRAFSLQQINEYCTTEIA